MLRGCCAGEGMLNLRFDWYINQVNLHVADLIIVLYEHQAFFLIFSLSNYLSHFSLRLKRDGDLQCLVTKNMIKAYKEMVFFTTQSLMKINPLDPGCVITGCSEAFRAGDNLGCSRSQTAQ